MLHLRSLGNYPYLLMNILKVSNCAEICFFQPLRAVCNLFLSIFLPIFIVFHCFCVHRVKQTLSIITTDGGGTQGVVGANEEEWWSRNLEKHAWKTSATKFPPILTVSHKHICLKVYCYLFFECRKETPHRTGSNLLCSEPDSKLLAQPDDPSTIRVASVIAFSVCSLSVLCYIFLILL